MQDIGRMQRDERVANLRDLKKSTSPTWSSDSSKWHTEYSQEHVCLRWDSLEGVLGLVLLGEKELHNTTS